MMRKFKSRKGFTLAELLVVVAIISVRVAMAIPVFGASQKKAKLAVDHAAIRDAYALVQIANNLQEVEVMLDTGDMKVFTFDELMAAPPSTDPGYADPRVFSYALSKDCSYLIQSNLIDKCYIFQTSGTADDGTPCPDCAKWDGTAAFPLSKSHCESFPIYAIFDKTQRRIVLGFA